MANKDSKPHLYIGNNGSKHPLKKKPLGSNKDKPRPSPNRGDHISHLSSKLKDLFSFQSEVKKSAVKEGVERVGMQVTFESFEGFELVFSGLTDERQKVELLNIQFIENVHYATVFVPEGKLTFFQKKLENYAATIGEDSPKGMKLIESIASLGRATIEALWTDSTELFQKIQISSSLGRFGSLRVTGHQSSNLNNSRNKRVSPFRLIRLTFVSELSYMLELLWTS